MHLKFNIVHYLSSQWYLLCWVHSLNLHKFHFIFGCLTLWKHLPSQCISTLGNNGESRIIFSCSCYTAFAISQGWIWTITLVGLITLFWASLNATKQQDLKGILAFSTVSQLGMIMSMLGIGAVSYHFEGSQSQLYIAGFTAAVFHLVNHATFKGALFMITGAVVLQAQEMLKTWWFTNDYAYFIYNYCYYSIKYGRHSTV